MPDKDGCWEDVSHMETNLGDRFFNLSLPIKTGFHRISSTQQFKVQDRVSPVYLLCWHFQIISELHHDWNPKCHCANVTLIHRTINSPWQETSLIQSKKERKFFAQPQVFISKQMNCYAIVSKMKMINTVFFLFHKPKG